MRKTTNDKSEGLRERLATLGGFCAAFEADGFKVGEWRGGKPDADGTFEFLTSSSASQRGSSSGIAAISGCNPSSTGRIGRLRPTR